jgi:uncharacterized membrane protein YphA (DoxX/SURF4 family)
MENTEVKKSKSMNIILWIAQCILAAIFLMAGVMKSTTPIEQLSAQLPWVKDFPQLERFIGISELLGGIGLLLPSILRIKPILTPFAALGIIAIMLLASAYHISKGEFSAVGFTLTITIIAAFVAWGRFKKAPILPRQ